MKTQKFIFNEMLWMGTLSVAAQNFLRTVNYAMVEQTQILDSDWGLDHAICGALAAKFGRNTGCVIIQATPLLHMDMKTHFRKDDDRKKKANTNANNIYKATFPSFWDGDKFTISRMMNIMDLYPERFADPYDFSLCSPAQLAFP